MADEYLKLAALIEIDALHGVVVALHGTAVAAFQVVVDQPSNWS
jgi:hypothetical protein